MFSFALLDTSILLLFLFAIGTISVLSTLAYNEKSITSTAVVVGILVALQVFTTDAHPFTWVYAHPVLAIVSVVAYLAAGVVYLYVRWRWFFIARIKIAHTEFMRNPSDDLATSNETAFVRRYGRELGFTRFPIKVSDYKGMLYCWNFYWPLLIVHSVVKDPLRLFRERIGKTLQNVADTAFEK